MRIFTIFCILLFAALSTVASLGGPTAGTQMTAETPSPPEVVDGFKAKTKQTKLTCTSSGQVHTCTSDYAFPCPDGWSACRLPAGKKTCCTSG